jgi:hypothetical protein
MFRVCYQRDISSLTIHNDRASRGNILHKGIRKGRTSSSKRTRADRLKRLIDNHDPSAMHCCAIHRSQSVHRVA